MSTQPNVALTPTAKALIQWLRREGRREVDLVQDQATLSKITSRPRWLLSEMHRRGLAHPVQWGRYLVNLDGEATAIPEVWSLDPLAQLLLARFEQPYFLSWHSALWRHGLIDQQSNRLLVAVTFRKRDADFATFSIRFVTVRPRKFFGWATEGADGVHVATVEKALIDSFDRHELSAPMPIVADALKRAWRADRLDPEKLVADAVRFGSPSVIRRLGFFMDLFAIPGAEPLALRIGRNHAIPLAPGAASDGPVNSKWLVFEDPLIVQTALQPK